MTLKGIDWMEELANRNCIKFNKDANKYKFLHVARNNPWQ